MVKKLFIWLLLIIPASFLSAETEPPSPLSLKIGDSAEKVKEVLGEPKGLMETSEFGIYYYKLGNVHLKAGKVSALNLISEQEWNERQTAEAEARKARRIQGEEILQSIKEDPDFASLPAANRVAFWERFHRDYPDVDIYALQAQAKVEADLEKQKQQEQERIANLERRVRNAEQQANRAVQAVEKQKIENRNRVSYRSPPVIYYPQPYVIRNIPRHPGSSSGNSLSFSGNGVNLNIGLNSHQSSTTTRTSGFVNSQNGVMRVQSREGFIQDFY